MQARKVLWVVGMSVLLGSCGSDDKPVVDNREGMKSGSRLKLRWYDFDGEKLPAGLFDSQRNEACTPVVWPDGQHYCTPKFEGPRQPIFRDAACTVRIAQTFPGCEAAPEAALFAQADREVCSFSSAFRPTFDRLVRGSRITLTEHYADFGTGCIRIGASSSAVYYELGAELSTAELAAFSVEKPEGDGELQLVYASSADGARLPLHGFDRALDTSCTLRPTRDAQALRCMPDAQSTGEYSDPACQQSKIGFPAGCAPSSVALVPGKSCTADLTVHRIGAETSATPSYAKTGEACGETDPATGYTYYTVGEEITLQSASRDPLAKGGPRIQTVRFSDDDLRLASSLIDTRYQHECDPVTLADGTIRCLPRRPFSVVSRFADDACQTSIDLLYDFNQCGDIPLPPLTYAASNSCPTVYQAFEIGDRYVGALYRVISGTCTRIDQGDPGTYYSLGASIPLADLAQGTLVTDP